MLRWPDKDPNEILDYQLNWSARLQDDIIVSSFWEANGVTIDEDSHTEHTTTVWLSGGELRKRALLTNRITTSSGRVMDQSVSLAIKSK